MEKKTFSLSMVEKLRYTLIQFASMTANLMSNMKTRQTSFNSFFAAVFTNWKITFRVLKYQEWEEKLLN